MTNDGTIDGWCRTLCTMVVGLCVILHVSDSWAQCQRAKLTAPVCTENDFFGRCVDVRGDQAICGAIGSGYSGAAYVFEGDGTSWEWQTQLLSDDGAPDDWLGHAVTLGPGVAIVGAPYDGDLGLRSGSAYVFVPVGETWEQVDKLVPQDGAEYELFGFSAALSNDFLLIGAQHDDDNGYRSGSAYIYERDPNGEWQESAKLLANDGESYDKFGTAVALDGDVAAIGAPYDRDLGSYAGSAYIFERDPNGAWAQVAKLLPNDGGPMWKFGETVAISGSRALIGAATAQIFAPSGGAAYVFERDPNGAWIETAELISDDVANSDMFGASVALNGDIAVIGAWGDDEHGEHTGAAYVFVCGTGGQWTQLAKLLAEDGAAQDYFGCSVALDGNTTVIGAKYDDDYGADSGSAYVFAVGPDLDGNGIMDVCECIGDLDADFDVDFDDATIMLDNFGMPAPAYEDGDVDADSDVDIADLWRLQANFGMTCP